MKKHFELPENIKNIILEITKKSKEIELGNLQFEYSDKNNFYTVHLTEYREYWQVVHRGLGEFDDRADIYKLSFDGILEFDWSEQN